MSWASWTCRMGKNTKPKLARPLSERADAFLTRAFAMQSSPAPASRGQSVTQRGAGQAKTWPPPSRQTRSAWGRAFPEPRVPGNLWLWLAGALNHMTALVSSGVLRGPAHASPSQPLKAQTPLGALCKLCRRHLQQVAGRGAENTDLQVSGRSPADGGRHPASFLGRSQTSRIAQPCLVQTCPKHTESSRLSEPHGALPHSPSG